MKRIGTIAGFAATCGLAAALGACSTASNDTAMAEADPATPPPSAVAYAQLKGADGTMHGRAVFTDDGSGVAADIQLEGLPGGTHGVHLHETGTCTPPDFTSAGGHWNPTNQPHPQHKGDLGNVTAGADGTANLRATIEGVSVASGATPMIDMDGAALIVHAMADDMASQPSGDAGARIACSAITVG